MVGRRRFFQWVAGTVAAVAAAPKDLSRIATWKERVWFVPSKRQRLFMSRQGDWTSASTQNLTTSCYVYSPTEGRYVDGGTPCFEVFPNPDRDWRVRNGWEARDE